MTTDGELIARSRSDPHLFGAIFDRHAPRVHRYTLSRCGEAAADDLMAQTFLIAFERRTSFDTSRTDALPWLLGIATNVMHRHRRSEVRNYQALLKSAPLEAADDARDMNERMDAQRAVHDLLRTLDTLPAGQRDAFLLFALEDLSYDQIAEALRIPLGTVRSRLNRARQALRSPIGTNTSLSTTPGGHHE